MTLTITDALSSHSLAIVAQAWDLSLADVESIQQEVNHLIDSDATTEDEMLARTTAIDARYGMRDIE